MKQLKFRRIEAMKAEIQSLEDNNTWVVVSYPTNKKSIATNKCIRSNIRQLVK